MLLVVSKDGTVSLKVTLNLFLFFSSLKVALVPQSNQLSYASH
jgi:hypothetical protein